MFLNVRVSGSGKNVVNGDTFLNFHENATALLTYAFEEKEQAEAFGLLYIASIFLQD
jgi:hypothetical protein